MTIRTGAWDCPTCGRLGNRGPEKHCAGCGHPRGEEVKLYLPEDAPELDEEEALQRALAGPDWTCGHCDGDNRAEYAHCTGCGAPRGDSAARRVVVHHTPVSASSARTEPAAATASAESAATAPPPQRPDAARRKELKKRHRRRKGCRRPLLIGVLVLLGLVAAVAFCGRTSETTATVDGFAWERKIAIEKLVTATETALPSQVPRGARRLDDAAGEPRTRTVTEPVQVGTERVKVGVRDLGNGYFEDVYEDRPIFEMRQREVPVRPPGGMVRYEIDRWQTVREARAAGSDRSPRWPAPATGQGERAGPRSESLTVLFADDEGRRLVYRARDESEWRGFALGQIYRVEATASGRVRSLRPG